LGQSEPDRVIQVLDHIAEMTCDTQDDDLTNGMCVD
jgi:hypothetical protein